MINAFISFITIIIIIIIVIDYVFILCNPQTQRRFRAGTALTTIADSDAGSDAGTDATGGAGTDLRAVVASVPIFADTAPEFVDALVAGLEMRRFGAPRVFHFFCRHASPTERVFPMLPSHSKYFRSLPVF